MSITGAALKRGIPIRTYNANLTCFPGADYQVQLVDEQNDLAIGFLYFAKNSLQAFFKLLQADNTRHAEYCKNSRNAHVIQ
jgi:hypothetical protein